MNTGGKCEILGVAAVNYVEKPDYTPEWELGAKVTHVFYKDMLSYNSRRVFAVWRQDMFSVKGLCLKKKEISMKLFQKAPVSRPERNPFLSADIYGVTHINPAQQNSIPYRIPLKTQRIDLESLVPVWGGPVNNATYASATSGYFWSISTDRVALIDARGKKWEKIADINLPGAKRRTVDDFKADRRVHIPRHGGCRDAPQGHSRRIARKRFTSWSLCSGFSREYRVCECRDHRLCHRHSRQK